jgi:NAD dependent epimerase/dehydratase family
MSSQAQYGAGSEPQPLSLMRLLVTGGTGVLGRAFRPLAEAVGHEVVMPGREGLDLYDASAVADAVRDVDGVLHLATRIPPFEHMSDPGVWNENDRLRAEASRILVDAAISADVAVYIQPSVAFVYPAEGLVSEETPLGEVLRSCAPPSWPRGRPNASRALEDAASCCDSACSTARAPANTQRWPTSAARCTYTTRGARCSRHFRCPAASTTSAVTGSASRASALPWPPAGSRPRRSAHDHLGDDRPPEPLQPLAVAPSPG